MPSCVPQPRVPLPQPPPHGLKTYAGTFVIAFATLALEVALTRLLSVVTWYHLAFFAISSAMLGMTAAAVRVYLGSASFKPEQLDRRLRDACTGFAVVVPLSLIVLCRLPLTLVPSVETLAALFVATLACALPFYFSGIAITAVLTKHPLPVTRVYAADLIGASMGCLFVLGGLEVLDVPSLILLCAALGALAGLLFGRGLDDPRGQRLTLAVLVLLTVGTVVNATVPYGIQPSIVKGRLENPREYVLQRWNSFSRVVVYDGSGRRLWYWGASPHAPQPDLDQFYMNIDGAAGTAMGPFATPSDVAHLRFDVTNVVYYLRPTGGAAIIGVGGGRDVQSALSFGQERVYGIEVNPIFIDLLQNEFRDFANIADRPGVTLVVDDARTHLARSRDSFAVIQMSMIDTWASTGAGAYSMSENGLYTVEAWTIFLDRLADGGIFTVSRWHSPESLGETGRVISLAVATLLNRGAARPADHIALITTANLSTLLVGQRAFSEQEITTLADVAEELGFKATILPGRPIDHPELQSLLWAQSSEELAAAAAGVSLNVRPPTDDNPYFFNMLRLRDLRDGWRFVSRLDTLPQGALRGNMIASVVLASLILSLALLCALTILVPLLATKSSGAGGGSRLLWSGAAYFSLIGGAFMLLEIGLIQRLSVFLGHPVYALGILLFTIILSTGVGSLASERIPITRAPWTYVYPLVTALAICGIALVFPTVAAGMEAAPVIWKIFASVALIFPVGILLGFFFPTGMRLVEEVSGGQTPWYWALNGIFGVLFSAIAVFIAIYFGITTNIYLSAIGYALSTFALMGIQRHRIMSETHGVSPGPA